MYCTHAAASEAHHLLKLAALAGGYGQAGNKGK